jgi:hypothetical protein
MTPAAPTGADNHIAMDEDTLELQMALAKFAIQQSTRAISALVTRAGTNPDLLRGSLDVMHRTRALATEDPIAENLAVTMVRASLDRLHADQARRS